MTNARREPSTWRHEAAVLRQRGVARRAHDTVATMQARTDAGVPSGGPPLRLVPALFGEPAQVDRIAGLLRRYGARRSGPRAVIVPVERLAAARAALVRAGYGCDAASPVTYDAEPDAAVCAAARFVLALGDALGWSSDLRPPALAALPEPLDPGAARQAESLVRAWLAALDGLSDPLAEVIPVPRPMAPAPLSAALARLLRRALRHGLTVRLRYAGAARSTPLWRDVEPLVLERYRGHPVLRGYCRLRATERFFRLDRIHSAQILVAAGDHIPSRGPLTWSRGTPAGSARRPRPGTRPRAAPRPRS